tara:strand:- start:934 stop:1851 length:918 start_codon:yes stop_codon:yes gene_type:complete
MDLCELVKNYPKLDKPIEIDLVIDGGAFNGLYTLGGLLLIKKLEDIKYLKVVRISGCSIGSILGFMYFNNSLDNIYELDKKIRKHLKKNLNFKLNQYLIKEEVNKITDEKFNIIKNNKLYISYFKNGKERSVKKIYKNKEELIETLIKSSHIPYLIDENFYYKQDNAVDGVLAHIFKKLERKTIFYDNTNLKTMFNLNNEINSVERIMDGVLKTHRLLLKNEKSQLCNYLNNWSNYEYFKRNLKLLIVYIVVKIISTIYDICILINNFFSNNEKFKEIKYGEITCNIGDILKECVRNYSISYIFN